MKFLSELSGDLIIYYSSPKSLMSHSFVGYIFNAVIIEFQIQAKRHIHSDTNKT